MASNKNIINSVHCCQISEVIPKNKWFFEHMLTAYKITGVPIRLLAFEYFK